MNKTLAWRQSIQKSDLQATTRHVLMNLSIYMDADGKSCFPTTLRQAQDTGLSEKSVITHIEKAVQAGFLKKAVRRRGGKGWASHEYEAMLPGGTEPLSVPKHTADRHGTEPVSVPSDAATEREGSQALNVVQPNSPINSTKKEPHYLWCGQVIKLTEKDFRAWQALAGIDEDAFAEYLGMRDQWLRQQVQAVRARWFVSTGYDIKNKFKKSGT